MLDVYLRGSSIQPLVRTMLFENAWVAHLRNKKRHTIRPFHRSIQEKRYNLNPVMVCGVKVDKMIQAKLVSSHVCFHFVREAEVPPRTCKDVLDTGIWPEHWDPSEMLGKINDGKVFSRAIPSLCSLL